MDITFKQYITEIANVNKKVLYIARGLPGSGKSYTIKEIVPKDQIYSTDDFWGQEYNFDINKLGLAHNWNQKRVLKAMKQGLGPIAVDNTNITWKEIKPYNKMAKQNGYDVKYVESYSPWWKEISQHFGSPNFRPGNEEFDKAVEILYSKNVHGVPKETLAKMLMRWTPTSQLPNAR